MAIVVRVGVTGVSSAFSASGMTRTFPFHIVHVRDRDTVRVSGNGLQYSLASILVVRSSAIIKGDKRATPFLVATEYYATENLRLVILLTEAIDVDGAMCPYSR